MQDQTCIFLFNCYGGFEIYLPIAAYHFERITDITHQGFVFQNLLGLLPCDCNLTRTHKHLVRKRTLNHLAKLASCEFESSYSHLNFRFRPCFEQGIP